MSLSRGWALGGAAFKRNLLKDHAIATDARAWTPEGARELREARWDDLLEKALRKAGKAAEDAKAAPKSAAWKLALAAWMKMRTQASNGWLSRRLHLGTPAALSRNLTHYRRTLQTTDRLWQVLTSISAA